MPVLLILLAMLTQADAGRGLPEVPPPPERPDVASPYEEPEFEPGSLWSEVQARQLMGLDGHVRQVGDLITVHVLERTSTELDAATSTRRDSRSQAGLGALLGIEQNIMDNRPEMGGQIGIEGGSESSFEGRGATRRGSEVHATITAEVIDVLPGGNLRIWGWKQVRVNREVQYVVLEGVVRPRDIHIDNTVTSDLMATARIEITGSGVMADNQGPGFGARLLAWLWPF